jgi:hypothetical protein
MPWKATIGPVAAASAPGASPEPPGPSYPIERDSFDAISASMAGSGRMRPTKSAHGESCHLGACIATTGWAPKEGDNDDHT